MFLFLLMAFYDAKLAAFLSIPATAVQVRKSFFHLATGCCLSFLAVSLRCTSVVQRQKSPLKTGTHCAAASCALFVPPHTFPRPLPSLLHPLQPLQSVTDFGRLGLSACVRNHGNTINFLKGSYPEIPLKIFPTLPDALNAFQAGKCGGVIAVDLEVLYEMGPNDPAGHFCHIEPVGPKFGVAYYYAVSFGTNQVRAALDCLHFPPALPALLPYMPVPARRQ
jgi:hypothetical protein